MQATQKIQNTGHIDTPTETAAKQTSRKMGSGNLVAVGENLASGTVSGEMEFLGHLIWYSLAETRITRENLLEALENAGVDEEFAPRSP